MSIEKALADLTAALNANTAALSGRAPAEAPAAPVPAARTPKKAAAPEVIAAATVKPTAAQNAAAAQAPVEKAVTQADIKKAGDDLTILANHEPGGRARAVAILSEFGAQKMTNAPQAQIPAIHAKVKKALVEMGLAQEEGAVPSLV